MYQCERCCQMIDSIICPYCEYDNSEYIKQFKILVTDTNKTENNNQTESSFDIDGYIVAPGSPLGVIGGQDIIIKEGKKESINKEKPKKDTEQTIVFKISKKTAAKIISIAVVIILCFSLIHICDNCHKIYFGKTYHSFGGNTCSDCYEYYT